MSILKNSISKITAYLCDAGNDFIQSKILMWLYREERISGETSLNL